MGTERNFFHSRRTTVAAVSSGQLFPLFFSDSLTKIGRRQLPYPRCRRAFLSSHNPARPHMIRRFITVVSTGCLLTVSQSALAQTAYKLTDLGQVDGVGSFAVGINGNGQVAGFVIPASHGSRAVISADGQPFAYVQALELMEVSPEGIGP